jgi:hypothetical protein
MIDVALSPAGKPLVCLFPVIWSQAQIGRLIYRALAEAAKDTHGDNDRAMAVCPFDVQQPVGDGFFPVQLLAVTEIKGSILGAGRQDPAKQPIQESPVISRCGEANKLDEADVPAHEVRCEIILTVFR